MDNLSFFDLLRLVLWPNIWSILVGAFEKNVWGFFLFVFLVMFL